MKHENFSYHVHHINQKQPPGQSFTNQNYWWIERVSDGTCVYIDYTAGRSFDIYSIAKELNDISRKLNTCYQAVNELAIKIWKSEAL